MTYADKIAKRQATRWQPGGGREPIAPAVVALYRASMEIWDAFDIEQRALSVRHLERVSSAMKHNSFCEDMEPGEQDTGFPGVDPCWLNPERGLCSGCLSRSAEREAVRPLLNRAKRRLRAALDRKIGKAQQAEAEAVVALKGEN